MEIKITKEEYLTLLEMLFIADWILHAHQVKEEEATKKYQALREKFLALAPDYGLDRYVTWDPQNNRYYFTRQFEGGLPMLDFIHNFLHGYFWEELKERLAWRDLIQEQGKKTVAKMDLVTKIKKLEDFKEKYNQEFAQKGLERLKVVGHHELKEE